MTTSLRDLISNYSIVAGSIAARFIPRPLKNPLFAIINTDWKRNDDLFIAGTH